MVIFNLSDLHQKAFFTNRCTLYKQKTVPFSTRRTTGTPYNCHRRTSSALVVSTRFFGYKISLCSCMPRFCALLAFRRQLACLCILRPSADPKGPPNCAKMYRFRENGLRNCTRYKENAITRFLLWEVLRDLPYFQFWASTKRSPKFFGFKYWF